MLASAPPNEAQMKDTDFLLAGGELFALVVYAQLILENARIYGDRAPTSSTRSSTSWCATSPSSPCSCTTRRAARRSRCSSCLQMIAKPATDERRYDAVWTDHVLALDGAYEMNP